MLQIWTSSHPSKVYSNLSPVLKTCPDLPVEVTGNFSVGESTSIILALGSEALKKLQDEQLVHKNRTITSLRTKPVQRSGVPVLISYSPDIWEVDYRYYVDLLTDVGLAVRYHQTHSFDPVLGKYQYVHDFLQLIARIEARYEETGKPVDVFMDLETLGLDPFRNPSVDHPGAYIVTIQVTDRLTFAEAVRFDSRSQEAERLADPVFRSQINFLLNSPKIRQKGANFKYDLIWFFVRGGFECTNFTFDTTIVGSLLDENRSNALDVHVKIYAPRGSGYSDEFDRTADKDRMDLELIKSPERFLNYACGDVDFGLEVAEAQKKELLQDYELTRFYVNILHPAARAFEKIERGGVFIDMNAYQELKSDLEKEQVTFINQASKILGGRIVAKHMDQTKLGGLNLMKASLLIDFMFSPMGLNLKPKMFTAKPDSNGVPRPSTALEHLLMFEDDPKAKDFIQVIKEFGSAKKTYDTYVIGFMEHIRSDGRFHPTYFLYVGNRDEGEGGAITGRLSAHDPAWQTLPKHSKWAKRIRRCFPAPPGYVVTERDYSSGELRVIACIAHCLAMIQAFKEGIDLHARTGAIASKMKYEDLLALKETAIEIFEAIRQKGKAGNFGMVFGQMPPGFVVYAKQNYGVDFTLDEATEFRQGYFEEYHELLDYHGDCKKMAHKEGNVRTPLGRIKHLPLINSPNREMRAKAERQAINAPVQGCLTDMLLWTLALEHQAELNKIAPAFGATHDSANNYCPEDKVDIILPQQMEIMQNLPFHKVDWNPQLQFVADAKVGPNMGEMSKYKVH